MVKKAESSEFTKLKEGIAQDKSQREANASLSLY